MNKFVKGAKNLAFALSFVTVAACGNVKKADLDAALKGFKEEMDNKLKGKADNGTVNEDQSYVRRGDLKGFVKSEDFDGRVDGKIGDLEKKVVGLDVLDKSFVLDPANFVKNFGGNVRLSDGVLNKGKVTFSAWEGAGNCKVIVNIGERKFYDKTSSATLLSSESLDVLKLCIIGGAEVDWGNNAFFEEESTKSVKFLGLQFDMEAAAEVKSLAELLNLCFVAGKTFSDLKFNCWKVDADGGKVGGKTFKNEAKEGYKMLVDVLNKFKEDCCMMETDGIVFKGGMGWTSDGKKTYIEKDVKVKIKG